ncbi:TonB-dependent receptor domain-containing protein [Oleiharenicola lentus]|uniref:TonB-dependent receptor domain-containing protein n=1 Tax=Oleiharenicola lentus TaxID=2508720 RepID=UPI003F675508
MLKRNLTTSARSSRTRLLGLRIAALLATPGLITAQTPPTPASDQAVTLDKYVVTGSFIPQASAEPIAPVAIFTEADIRATGAMTPIQALRSLPSFIGNPGATENDSNGASGSTYVSLRGQGAAQTLVLIDGRPAGNNTWSNIQLMPIEAIERIEVLRDGAGIIYGSAAIGGAVNIILKKNYSGLEVSVMGGASTRSPGARETFQASFVTGASTDKTSIVISGSYFKNRTLLAGQRPNSALADNRPRGGVNTGSSLFAGVASSAALGLSVLRPNFSGTATPTGAGDYVPLDTNTFSSNQLFNFRDYSISAPGQKRNSLYLSFEHQINGKALEVFGTVLYANLATRNGLAPAPFRLLVNPTQGPAAGALTQWGPYNELLGAARFRDDGVDWIQYRSVELGNRTSEQVYNDFKYVGGLRGEIGSNWNWEASYTVNKEIFDNLDAGVPSLPLLDAEVKAGRFNPFALAHSVGSAVVNGITYNWDNAKALKAAEVTARQRTEISGFSYNGRVAGSLFELPAGKVGLATGVEYTYSDNDADVDDIYSSGSVLGLPSAADSYGEDLNRAIFAEIKIPLLSENNQVPFVHDLSIGALARKEEQVVKGLNGNTDLYDSRTYDKTNPSVNLQYAPTKNYKLRATYSKGFLAPSSGFVFGSAGASNPTLADPLGFPTAAQTTLVIRGNPDLKPAVSKAWSVGLVAQPKGLSKNLSLAVDFYNIKVDGVVANNANAILAANAAGQGAGFIPGNAATINPNAPFANQIRRSADGRLNSSGSFADTHGVAQRGAVLSDYLNIATRDVSGVEYTATYTLNTATVGRVTLIAAANQFVKFDQTSGPGLPAVSYLGKSVSTVGDPISPGSIPKWKGNFTTQWNWHGFSARATFNYIGSFQDDPLFVMSPKMKAFYDAGTPKSDPAFAAFLADSTQLKVGGFRMVEAWKTFDTQLSYEFSGAEGLFSGLTVTLGANNVFDELAPFAAGGFNDSYDTRTHNNIGRFVYLNLSKKF